MSARLGSRRALVTGGAGFIGGHLVAGLVAEGWRVRVLDDFSSGRDSNLADVIDVVELLRGDVRDEAALARAVAGVEVVFHQAAVASVPASVAEPLRTSSVNLDGTLKVLEASRRAGVRRVVYAASSSAYGNDEELPKVETMQAEPLSPYALQKLTGELLLPSLHAVCTGSRRSRSATSTSSDRGRTRAASTRRWSPASSARRWPGRAPPSSATASRRATSSSCRTRCTRTCWPPTPSALPAP